jgi:hypothetical protein
MRARNNYTVLHEDMKEGGGFTHYKADAIRWAKEYMGPISKFIPELDCRTITIRNNRTEQITHLLPRDRCDCNVCGNELEGKLHCKLCGALHYYM